MKSVKVPISGTLDIKKSKFLAFIHPISDEAEAKRILADYHRQFPNATHHCHAYRVSDPPTQSVSDDGEPKRTAGLPILDIMDKHGLTDVIAVVVRYFGGVKLGSSGLIRAYAKAVSMALETAQYTAKQTRFHCAIHLPIEAAGRLEHLIREQTVVLDAVYGEDAAFTVDIAEAGYEALAGMLAQALPGDVRIDVLKRYKVYH